MLATLPSQTVLPCHPVVLTATTQRKTPDRESHSWVGDRRSKTQHLGAGLATPSRASDVHFDILPIGNIGFLADRDHTWAMEKPKEKKKKKNRSDFRFTRDERSAMCRLRCSNALVGDFDRRKARSGSAETPHRFLDSSAQTRAHVPQKVVHASPPPRGHLGYTVRLYAIRRSRNSSASR